MTEIAFNRPHMTGKELHYISQAHASAHLSGDGGFTARCQAWLERRIGCRRALLTHSATAALEMCALLLDLKERDEVIMPSFTFVSTANAFALRGAVPVFVDVRADTLNIDEKLLDAAWTPRTRAVVVVHYAGVACAMDAILEWADRRGLPVIEDAAQGIEADYRSRPLGNLGALACLSFHETKNVHCGEGGALLINDPALVARAEILRQKGTNRSQFLAGLTDKYTWVDVGSSFLPSELNAAFLWAQLEEAAVITERRRAIWDAYHVRLRPLMEAGAIELPAPPTECRHNAHLFHVLVPAGTRSDLIRRLRSRGVHCIFHYVPLHSSPAGRRLGRVSGTLPVTEERAERLMRLPLWIGLEEQLDRVVEALERELKP
jgi:dTDP-4-amino-4,6-dideoxygalactose transaminase